jgi:hypothetical protein
MDGTPRRERPDESVRIQNALNGDPLAIEEDYRDHEPALLSFARRILKNDADAEGARERGRAARAALTRWEKEDRRSWMKIQPENWKESAIKEIGTWDDRHRRHGLRIVREYGAERMLRFMLDAGGRRVERTSFLSAVKSCAYCADPWIDKITKEEAKAAIGIEHTRE